MTQIATYRAPSAGQGPRGLQGHNSGGAYSRDSQEDLAQADSFLAGLEVLTGTTDAIAFPYVPPFPIGSTNFIIQTAGVDAITLALPRNPMDDNQSVNIWSDTANAHTVTFPSAAYSHGATGQATIATFAAFRGAGMTLRAFNGTWQVVASSGVTFS